MILCVDMAMHWSIDDITAQWDDMIGQVNNTYRPPPRLGRGRSVIWPNCSEREQGRHGLDAAELRRGQLGGRRPRGGFAAQLGRGRQLDRRRASLSWVISQVAPAPGPPGRQRPGETEKGAATRRPAPTTEPPHILRRPGAGQAARAAGEPLEQPLVPSASNAQHRGTRTTKAVPARVPVPGPRGSTLPWRPRWWRAAPAGTSLATPTVVSGPLLRRPGWRRRRPRDQTPEAITGGARGRLRRLWTSTARGTLEPAEPAAPAAACSGGPGGAW
jgi:hypothetical protein